MKLETPWTRARKTRNQLQEKRLGEVPEGRIQPNSGRLWRWKRDGIRWNFLVEARTTEAGSYRIDRDEWIEIRKQALRTPPSLKPMMEIEIQDTRLIVLEDRDWEAVYTRLIDLEGRLGEEAEA